MRLSSILQCLLYAVLLSPIACATGHDDRPRFDALGHQVAFVGSELSLLITATDPDGDELQYAFESSLQTLCGQNGCRAGVLKDQGEAFFRWVPQADDVGTHEFRFYVTDGKHVSQVDTTIEVRSSIGYNGLPRFVQPLGAGATLDIAKNDCFDFDVIVDDPDSPSVTISAAPPVVAGLSLRAQDGFSARLHWCPTASQIHSSGVHSLVLLAADQVNPPTEKDFALVLRRPAKPECSGKPPVIQHTVQNWNGAGDIALVARVQDDVGLKHPPIVYYWTARPMDPTDLSRAKQVMMTLNSGTSSAGVWTGMIPNPTARSTTSLTEKLYYKISVTDNDDHRGSCDHTSEHPGRGFHEIDVTPASSDMMGEATTCDVCRADAQCAGASDLCVNMGTKGASYCLLACENQADCESGYVCSQAPVVSVERRMGRLCTPVAEVCEQVEPLGCADDAYEDNDTPETATPFAAGTLEPLTACVEQGRADADWFVLDVNETSQVQVNVAGDTVSDLDLAVTNETGGVIAIAESLRTQEDLALCLSPGSYRAQVKPIGEVSGEYGIEWSARGAACDAKTGTCEPDGFENDDSQESARKVDWMRGYAQSGNTVCSGDEDWYEVNLEAGQTFAVDLTFTQTSTAEDLDLHFYQEDGTSLTPCSEADPSGCSSFQGQSVDSNEYYDFLAERAGRYYLVVKGFGGSSNTYDIRIYAP